MPGQARAVALPAGHALLEKRAACGGRRAPRAKQQGVRALNLLGSLAAAAERKVILYALFPEPGR